MLLQFHQAIPLPQKPTYATSDLLRVKVNKGKINQTIYQDYQIYLLPHNLEIYENLCYQELRNQQMIKITNFFVIFHCFLAIEEVNFEALWEDFDTEAGFIDLKFKIKETLKR